MNTVVLADWVYFGKGVLIRSSSACSADRRFLALKWFIRKSPNFSTAYGILSAMAASRTLPKVNNNEIGLHASAIL